MSDKSGIEWTDATWNPIVGCSVVSPGCTNCYAMKQAYRIRAMADGAGRATHYQHVVRMHEPSAAPIWTNKVGLAPDHILTVPLRWKRPRKIFVNSMGDLFHENVPDAWIDRVFAAMALAPQHTFQVLTKRSKRMREYLATPMLRPRIDIARAEVSSGREDNWKLTAGAYGAWPIPNVWLGVSAERQQEADARVPDLLATPAAVRFVSGEPLLGAINFEKWIAPPVVHHHPDNDQSSHAVRLLVAAIARQVAPRLDWIIVGGESGPGARPMHPDWPRAIRDQCAAAGVAFFFKQWGEWAPFHPDWPRASGSVLADDGTLYRPSDLAYPDGPRYGDAIRANHDKARLTTMYRIGKRRAGRLLDGVEHNAFPDVRTPSFDRLRMRADRLSPTAAFEGSAP
jgi:protein gp37